MSETVTHARVGPLAEDEWPKDSANMLAGLKCTQPGTPNIFATIARHSVMFKPYMGLGSRLLHSSRFTFRQQKIVILRVAWDTNCRYMWGQHTLRMEENSMTHEDFAKLAGQPPSAFEDRLEGALVAAVDELNANAGISDETYGLLSEYLDEEQLIELNLLVGHYHMTAFVANSLHIEPEPWTLDFPVSR